MASSPQPTILVVEDNGALRRLMTRTLADSGFLVLEAGSAPHGLAVFQAEPLSVDLAVIDMVMPGMSGLDLAAELERERPGMKILYISGYSSSVAIESISRRSPDRVLLKPFDVRDLVERVGRLLGPEPAQTDAHADTIAAMGESTFAWDRLMEASDAIAGGTVEIMGYRNTGAAFSIAAAHSAALRAAGLDYAFRPKEQAQLTYGLFVAEADARHARELLERVGLGVDIAQPV
ncbi:MAG: response regulator [Acidobacteriia bacterium]|nr:response regulator [Terriglobia bacterium]